MKRIYASMDELISDYESGALHPIDVKLVLSKALNEILQPVRDYFRNNKEARELLETVKGLLAGSGAFSFGKPGRIRESRRGERPVRAILSGIEGRACYPPTSHRANERVRDLLLRFIFDKKERGCRAEQPNPESGLLLTGFMANVFESKEPSVVDDAPDVGSITLAASSSNSQAEPSLLSLDERFALVRSIGEECIQEDELRSLLEKKRNPICYDRFEPYGRMHIAQGIMKTINVNKLTSVGCTVKIWIEDGFAQLNNKSGGDQKKIRKIGEYLIEIWKAAGMKTERVEFLWASNEMFHSFNEYWPLVMDIARMNTLPRIVRDQDELMADQIFYPCMQCTNILFLKADICQLGMDEGKVNVLARQYCDNIK